MKKIEGLVAAAFTPMKDNGELHLEQVARLHNYYREQKLKGVFLNGTTGEGLSLTVEERKQTCEAWCSLKKKELRLIVFVGSNSLAEARDLASHAARQGADGISISGPFYQKPEHLEDLVTFCQRVADAAEGVPFYYYHIPVLTGIRFPMIRLLEMAASRIPTLAGIKYTDSDLADYRLCLEFEPDRLDLLYGRDEMFLAARATGATGYVGSTYNLFPSLYGEISRLFDSGDLAGARSLQSESIRRIEQLAGFRYLPAAKWLMKRLGVDCGPVRAPLRSLSPQEERSLSEELDYLPPVV